MTEPLQSRPQLPIIGVIGPTNIARVSRASNLDASLYEHYAFQAGRLVAEANAAITLVPDRGVALHAMQGYQATGGPWSIALAPNGGPSEPVASSNCDQNADQCHETLRRFTWHQQHAQICELSDLLVCVGLSCGTLTEIAWTKWVGKPRVLVMRETVSVLPPEILAETQVEFMASMEELETRINAELAAAYAGTSTTHAIPAT